MSFNLNKELELIKKIKELKGFRNNIVHRYGKIDDKLSFELIKENLGNFEKITERIEEIVSNN